MEEPCKEATAAEPCKAATEAHLVREAWPQQAATAANNQQAATEEPCKAPEVTELVPAAVLLPVDTDLE